MQPAKRIIDGRAAKVLHFKTLFPEGEWIDLTLYTDIGTISGSARLVDAFNDMEFAADPATEDPIIEFKDAEVFLDNSFRIREGKINVYLSHVTGYQFSKLRMG